MMRWIQKNKMNKKNIETLDLNGRMQSLISFFLSLFSVVLLILLIIIDTVAHAYCSRPISM